MYLDLNLFTLIVVSAAFQTCDQREMQTLNKRQRKRLRTDWQLLTELTDCQADELITKLRGSGCLTERQVQVIEKQSSSMQIKKLLDILSRKGLPVVDSFISCLPETTQHHVQHLLSGDYGNFT